MTPEAPNLYLTLFSDTLPGLADSLLVAGSRPYASKRSLSHLSTTFRGHLNSEHEPRQRHERRRIPSSDKPYLTQIRPIWPGYTLSSQNKPAPAQIGPIKLDEPYFGQIRLIQLR